MIKFRIHQVLCKCPQIGITDLYPLGISCRPGSIYDVGAIIEEDLGISVNGGAGEC